jgi:hypothetical protein
VGVQIPPSPPNEKIILLPEINLKYENISDKEASCHNQVRVIDESGEDYLFPAALFVTI